MVQQADLFYPVRGLFIPHMVNSLHKLGVHGSASTETRHLSIDLMQTIVDWEKKAAEDKPIYEAEKARLEKERRKTSASDEKALKVIDEQLASLVDPPRVALSYRENVVSQLVRLITQAQQTDVASRSAVIGRALGLLKQIVGPNGWKDVTVKLHFFGRMLEQVRFHLFTVLVDELLTRLIRI